MKIYVIKGNNCEEYEDYYEWIEKASKDYKKNCWDKKEYEIKEYNIKDYNEGVIDCEY